MTMQRYAALVVLLLATVPSAWAQTTAADGDPSFAVRATERLVLHAGARIRGGAVGAFDPSRVSTAPGGAEVIVDGARIAGDVYGESVRVSRRAKVRRVFAQSFV